MEQRAVVQAIEIVQQHITVHQLPRGRVQFIKLNLYVVRLKILFAVNRATLVFDAVALELLAGFLILIQNLVKHLNIMAVKVLKLKKQIILIYYFIKKILFKWNKQKILKIIFLGNRNNFASQRSCQNYCLSEACPPGTVVAKESGNSRLLQCSNPGGAGRVSGGCPEGYTCFSSPLLDQNVCCGASTDLQALCPAQSTPFISALSLQPMQCTPNVDGACPGNFFCWFSTTATSVNAFYCCRSPESIDTGCK